MVTNGVQHRGPPCRHPAVNGWTGARERHRQSAGHPHRWRPTSGRALVPVHGPTAAENQWRAGVRRRHRPRAGGWPGPMETSPGYGAEQTATGIHIRHSVHEPEQFRAARLCLCAVAAICGGGAPGAAVDIGTCEITRWPWNCQLHRELWSEAPPCDVEAQSQDGRGCSAGPYAAPSCRIASRWSEQSQVST